MSVLIYSKHMIIRATMSVHNEVMALFQTKLTHVKLITANYTVCLLSTSQSSTIDLKFLNQHQYVLQCLVNRPYCVPSSDHKSSRFTGTLVRVDLLITGILEVASLVSRLSVDSLSLEPVQFPGTSPPQLVEDSRYADGAHDPGAFNHATVACFCHSDVTIPIA